MQNKVGDALERVTNRYIIAYGGLARANLRSVEQAQQVRSLIIGRFLLKDSAIQANAEEKIARKGKEFWGETSLVHEMIGLELKDQHPFTDVATLSRLDEKVSGIEAFQKIFEENYKNNIALIRRGDTSALSREFLRLENSRNEINETIDTTRRLMLKTAHSMASEVLLLQNKLHKYSIILITLSSILALIIAWYITKNLVKPVRVLLEGADSVIRGRLDISLPVTSSDEIGHLTKTFNAMTAELLAGSHVRDMFGKYVDPRIVKNLIDKHQVVSSDGERKVMTILFCDMEGFTDLSEGMTPGGLVNILNRYFTLMSEAVHENEGVIDKYIGDAIMAYWGPPFNNERDQARLAAQAALAMYSKLEIFRSELPELMGIRRNLPKISFRTGIATGEVIVGNIGSEKTKNFTVIGDTVNLASRLEGTNKVYKTSVLISEETALMLGETIVTREIDTILVPGKNEAKKVFEVVGTSDKVPYKVLQLRDQYALGLAAYRGREWDKARAFFKACLAIDPSDNPSTILLARVEQFEKNPPEQSWNEAWIIMNK